MKERIRKHLSTVVVAFATAAIAAGGTAAAAALINADRLQGYPANGLTRVAQSHKSNNSVIGDGTDRVIRKVGIKAPRAGYLVVTASTDGYLDTGATGYANCWIELDGSKLTSTERSQNYYDSGAGENTEQDCATNVAWPVKAGKHTSGSPVTRLRVSSTTNRRSPSSTRRSMAQALCRSLFRRPVLLAPGATDP